MEQIQTKQVRTTGKRIRWIDFAKGIGILLVIVGHTAKNNSVIFTIYSFHMPLFFVMSMITSRLAASKEDVLINVKRAFCHLIIPAAGLWLLHDILYLLAYHSGMESIPRWAGIRVLSLLFASGQPVRVCGITVPALGILWFLVALFVGKTIFDGLHFLAPSPKKVTVASALLCVIGVALGQSVSLPFALDYALTVQPFFTFGLFLKRWRETPFSFNRFVISFIGWLAASLCVLYLCPGQKLDIALRFYPLFPMCFVMACFAVLTVSEISKFFADDDSKPIRFFSAMITKLGRYSIWLFGVHHMDGMWKRLYYLTDNTLCQTVLRIVTDIMVMILAKRIWGRIKIKRDCKIEI